ncbi:A/G-specific DNA-adenine glycosylase [Actinacidiphila yanglinensis]|uniref:Adenine DNA glycosylase n=1 Tax=Actinacidiphila yanglinensis TaxID=310779 RepID=A0A1H6DUJ5_9ACTN|nr:A/G-specific adenine glycosylase [Actinacidiphila yanglinensis]SEG88245.1 A/G-specific DNA-adenine glycosylase [Actinacidiphila yanglinensis]
MSTHLPPTQLSAPSSAATVADTASAAPGDISRRAPSAPAPVTLPATGALHGAVIDWFDEHARDLPWRRPDAGAWSVMVSEFMLQQTPVNRVLPVHAEWLERWPRPADLAKESPGEAVRAWGRLGYPRRALRLHAAATAIAQQHGGEVPREHTELLALPGIGEYTAAAVVSFAYGRRHIVLDTNVRRVFARLVTGVEYPPNATTAAERRVALALLPGDEDTAARWAAATMELGALVCTARSPQCGSCPLAARCAWRLAGSPAHQGPPRRGQTYAGTDRQVRGRLLAILRASHTPVARAVLDTAWAEDEQRSRALDGLITDGLVEQLPDDSFRLPA